MAAASKKKKENSQLHDYEAVTKTPMYSTTFYWKIQNFKHLQHKPGEGVMSPTFYTYGDDGERYQNVEWNLKLYPRGNEVKKDDEHKEHPGIFLICEGLNEWEEEIRVTCQLCVGKVKNSSNFDGGTFHRTFKTSEGWGLEKFLHRKLKDDQKHLLDEEFVITCKVRHPGQPISTCVTPRSTAGCTERPDLLPMYNEGLLTDVTISIENQEFKVHRVVLAAKSIVFKTLLTSDFSEASSNKIEISDADVSADACELMLLHMYGKKLPDDIGIDTAQGLLYLSEKYVMDGLKADCEAMLSSMITAQNVWRLLAASKKYRGDMLKQRCQKFISKNRRKILDVLSNNVDALGECALNDVTEDDALNDVTEDDVTEDGGDGNESNDDGGDE